MASAGPAKLHTSSFLCFFDTHVFEGKAMVPAASFVCHQFEISFCDFSAAIFALKVSVLPFYIMSNYFYSIPVMFCDLVSALAVF